MHSSRIRESFLGVCSIVFASAGIAITGCATTTQTVDFPDQSSEIVLNKKSRVYLIRSDLQGYAVPATVRSEGTEVGQLGFEGFLSFETNASELGFTAEIAGLGPLTTKITPRPGRNSYVIFGASRGMLSGIDTFSEISREDALASLMRVKPPANVQMNQSWFDYGIVEKWYYEVSFGVLAKTTFFGRLGTAEQQLKSVTGSSQDSSQLEIMGFYFPTPSNKTLVGMQLFGGGWDYYGDEWFDRFNISLSAMHFYSGRPAKGFFTRGDIGQSSIALVNKKTNIKIESETGANVLLGCGYAVRFTDSSMIIGLNNETAFYPSSKSNTTFLNIGWIW